MTAPALHWLGPFRFIGGPADGKALDWIDHGVEWVDVPVLCADGWGRARYKVHLEDKTLR